MPVLDGGHIAEDRRSEHLLCVLLRLNACVQVVHEEGEPHAQKHAQDACDRHCEQFPGFGRLDRDIRRLIHEDAVLGRTRRHGDLDLLNALRHVAVGLVQPGVLFFEDLVVGGESVEFHYVLCLPGQGRPQFFLLLLDSRILGLGGGQNASHLDLQFLRDGPQGAFSRFDLRMVWAEAAAEVAAEHLHADVFELQIPNGFAVLDLRHLFGRAPFGQGIANVLVAAFRLDAQGLRAGEIAAEFLEPLHHDVLAFLQRHHVVFRHEGLKLFGPCAELRPQLVALSTQGRKPALRYAHAALAAGLDVLLDEVIEGVVRNLGVAPLERHVRQQRIPCAGDREQLGELPHRLGHIREFRQVSEAHRMECVLENRLAEDELVLGFEKLPAQQRSTGRSPERRVVHLLDGSHAGTRRLQEQPALGSVHRRLREHRDEGAQDDENDRPDQYPSPGG